MNFPWSTHSTEDIEAVTTELIVGFGLHAREEAVRLAEIAKSTGAAKNEQLYRLAADRIQRIFDVAWEKMRQRRLQRHFDYLSVLNEQSLTVRVSRSSAALHSGEVAGRSLQDVA